MQALGAERGIVTQAWSPIGGITSYRDSERSALEDPALLVIAKAHGKSAAQVMLRRGIQEGRSAIPKSTKPERIAENFDVFDFELSASEIASIDALDTGTRGGPEPEFIALENFSRPLPEARSVIAFAICRVHPSIDFARMRGRPTSFGSKHVVSSSTALALVRLPA